MKPRYEDGTLKFYHGDCLEVMKEMPDESVDLIFTSPPYNLSIDSKGKSTNLGNKGGKWANAALGDGYGLHSDAMPFDEYIAWQGSVILECWRLLSPKGAIFYNHKPRIQGGVLWTPLELIPESIPLRQIITWVRSGGYNYTHTHYVPTYEWIILLAKDGFRLSSQASSGASDVWQVPQDGKSNHPAPFPMALPMKALGSISPGTVLDPFMGSGTTLEAARLSDWKGIGIELEDKYCEITEQRLSQGALF